MIWAVSLSTTKLSPRRLTHVLSLLAFAVWLGSVTSTWPLAHPALYLQQRFGDVAAPQCISGRTSYLHVRLEFLPYPQVIPHFCNSGGCEPRRSVTSASLCPWIAHVVSGPLVATLTACARFRLGFPLAPQLYRWLTSASPGSPEQAARRRRSRRIILQKARHQPLVALRHSGLWLLVRTGVQGLFHPPCGVLFTFPSRYWSTIGR
jgi:hypothetical protein